MLNKLGNKRFVKTRKLVSRIASLVIVTLLVFNAYLYVQQPAMIFYPTKNIDATPEEWELNYQSVKLTLSNNTKIAGWYFPHPDATKTLLFFHGNGGNISHRGDSIYIFHKLKLNVLIIDYPGYGDSEGSPSEEGLYQSATAAWHYLLSDKKVKANDIIIFGRSLGGAVAADLASRVTAGGLILESTFSSVLDIVDIDFPLLSHFIYLRYSFDSQYKLQKVTVPVLVIHSPGDGVIPFELGQKIFSGVTAEKKFLQIEGGHNDGFMQSIQRYMQSLRSFIQSI